MVVILKVRVVAETFALGRMLSVPEGARIELETLVARAERSQPYLWVVAPDVETTLVTIRERTPVDLTVVEVIEDRALVALDWDIERGDLFSGIRTCDGRILAVTGAHDGWEFGIRFPEHADMLEFRHYCEDRDIDFTVERIYHATRPTVDDSFGLTDRQREALELAVREGLLRRTTPVSNGRSSRSLRHLRTGAAGAIAPWNRQPRFGHAPVGRA